MEKKTLFVPLSIKLADGNQETTSKSFVGYGAYFDNVDAYGDKIVKGAFAASLARHKEAGTTPLMLLNHEAFRMPIGVWKSLSEDDSGLLVEGDLIDTTSGRDAYVAMKAGAITGLSIGFMCKGYEIDGNNRTITEADLLEVSVVTFPANDRARVTSVKSKQENETMTDDELKIALGEAGFNDEQIAALFASKADAVENDEAPVEEEDDAEAKYDEAAVMRAIKSIVATTKEIHVR